MPALNLAVFVAPVESPRTPIDDGITETGAAIKAVNAMSEEGSSYGQNHHGEQQQDNSRRDDEDDTSGISKSPDKHLGTHIDLEA